MKMKNEEVPSVAGTSVPDVYPQAVQDSNFKSGQLVPRITEFNNAELFFYMHKLV